MPVDPVRDAAVDVLLRVFERGLPLDVALDKTLRRKDLADRGRRFLAQLAFGTVRYRLLCDHVLANACWQPIDRLPTPIRVILEMGVFQAFFCSQVTRPAMVHTAVDLAKRRGHAGTARLVNAVLRHIPESLDAVPLPDPANAFEAYLSVRYSMPPWMVSLWVEEHGPAAAEALCAASNVQAETSLRVNTLKTTVEELAGHLAKAGITTAKRTGIPEELTVVEGRSLPRSRWFRLGHFLLQDPASMIAAHLLEPKPGEWVLDLCAAPGGKSTHLAQHARGEAHVVAMDIDAQRLPALRENVERLEIPGVSAICADGTQAPLRGTFDGVLVDAPCSGLGTLRRHPDLKWRSSRDALPRLARLQEALLRSAMGLCKNGGRIVYSVCTFSKQETRDLIRGIVADGPVQLEDGPEHLNRWRIAQGQYQTLPSNEALDGFFLTRLRKVS